MTLHEAIEHILLETGGPLTASTIADLINAQKLYSKKDGKPLSAAQVILRSKNYETQFDVIENLISLKKNVELSGVIISYKNLRHVLTELPNLNRDYIALFLLFTKRLIDTTTYTHTNIASIGLRPLFLDANQIKWFIGLVENIGYDMPLVNPISKDVVHLFKEVLHKFKAEELLFHLESIKTNKLKDEEFISLFNQLISETEYLNRKIPECTSSNNIRELLSRIFTPGVGDKVFDPFLGVGGQFIKLRNRCNYDIAFSGNEINEMAAALAAMNLQISDIIHADIKTVNSFNLINEEKFDCIISDPPYFGNHKMQYAQPENDYNVLFDKNQNIKSSLAPYVYIIDHLNSKGKAAFTVPEALLFATGPESIFRSILIEKDLLEAVIALPKNFNSNSNVRTNILIINKNKPQALNQLVHFINVTDTNDAETNIIRDILEKYSSPAKAKNSYFTSSQEIANEGYSLLARRYDPNYKKIIEERTEQGKNLIRLSDLTRKIKLEPAQIGTEFRCINSLTSKANTAFKVNLDALRSVEVEKKGAYLLNRSAILIDKSGVLISARIFEFTGESVIVGSNIVAVELITSAISDKFLCHQLNTDVLTIVQMARYYQGTLWEYITEKDLFTLLIDLPSLDDQNRILVDYLSKSEEVTESDRQVSKYKAHIDKDNIDSNIIPTLKHTINQPIATILLGVYSLKEFLSRKANLNQPIELSENIAPNIPESDPDKGLYTLENQLELISNNAALVQKYLKQVEGLVNLENYKEQLEKFGIRLYLEELIKTQFGGGNYIIKIEGSEFQIKADKQLLHATIQNIIQNAISHGFSPNSKKMENIIRIILQKVNYNVFDISKGTMDNLLTITIENNGLPIDESIVNQDNSKKNLNSVLEAKGGFGLIFVKKIIKRMQGSITIKRIPEDSLDDFKTKFIIILSLD